MSYFDISGAVFNNQLRELETSDPAHADVFNAVFRQLINNDVALMEAASMFAGEKNKQAEFILNLKRTGKKYGVHHSAFDVSPLSAGTRTLDAVGMVAQPSTNTVRGRNDFEGESVFYGLEVNGHVDDAGEFIVEYIKGIDNEFSRTERDTWMLYLTQWINITIEWLGIQENPQGGGWAAGKNYGSKILEILAKIIAMPEANKEDVTMNLNTSLISNNNSYANQVPKYIVIHNTDIR